MPNAEAPQILVCGWAGAGNIGDELLTRELIRRLHAAGARAVVASRNPVETRATHPSAAAVPWGPRGIRSIGDIDGVCVGPGGILQDSSSLWNLPGHLILPWVAKRRGAVVRSIGVGAEPFRRSSSGRMLRSILEGGVVSTRDDASTASLEAAGIAARTGADVVFGLPLPEVERRNEIVVAVGPSVGPGLITPASRRLRALDPAPIAAAIDQLVQRAGATAVLTAFRGARDHDAAKQIATHMSTAPEVLAGGVDEHVKRIVGARLVVSSRYHPVVLAAASGTPALVVSTQAKVHSLVEMINSPQVVLVPSWERLGAENNADRNIADRNILAVPRGLDETVEAIDELVQAARNVRSKRSLG